MKVAVAALAVGLVVVCSALLILDRLAQIESRMLMIEGNSSLAVDEVQALRNDFKTPRVAKGR
jgi:hypothetical protein